MFCSFDEASRDMTYFCVDPTWWRATEHDDSFTFLPPHVGYAKKNHAFAASKFKEGKKILSE